MWSSVAVTVYSTSPFQEVWGQILTAASLVEFDVIMLM
jgi:hypothetical protein